MKSITTLIVCALFSATGLAQIQEPVFDTVIRNGYLFEVEDISEIVLVENGNDVYVTKANPFPIPHKINGLNIYAEKDAETPASLNGGQLKTYLVSNMKNVTSKLTDGAYIIRLHNIILSHNGKIVYYDYDGIGRLLTNGETAKLNNYLEALTKESVEKVLDNAPKYRPAYIYNNPVACRISNKAFETPFYIRTGKVFFE